ncbi:gastrula zinc finger protein XlCGF8.2DB-like [Syngnathoides biaculeatus]|uniref:gastrula zinc finger protein XlCGF8.2DB-like n=1 Tax=Syngnathoides biaculeatus TaxID=300417 RepID=UPI002ADD434D|nr:gastrula zinc finger protein XlCGF8.2DB-like [Syngnathoides biaculeatus]
MPLTVVPVKNEDNPPEMCLSSILEDPRPPHAERDEDELPSSFVKVEGKEGDVSGRPLTVVPVKNKDNPPEMSQLPSGPTPRDELVAPLPLAGVVKETGGGDHELTKGSEKQTAKGRFSCSFCGKGYAYRCKLALHVKVHTGEKPFPCSICGKRFTQKVNMLSHTRTHTGEKPFSCSVCRKTFAHKSNMVAHAKTHTGERPFACANCGKTFFQKSNMLTHMKTHCGDRRAFAPAVCGKTYSHQNSLSVRARLHDEDKSLTCSVCGKKFSRMIDLRAHAGEKPCCCIVCAKRFAQKTHLEAHTRTHTGCAAKVTLIRTI